MQQSDSATWKNFCTSLLLLKSKQALSFTNHNTNLTECLGCLIIPIISGKIVQRLGMENLKGKKTTHQLFWRQFVTSILFSHASYKYWRTSHNHNIPNLLSFRYNHTNGKFKQIKRESNVTPFHIWNENFDSLYILVNGIYPNLSRFVKGIKYHRQKQIILNGKKTWKRTLREHVGYCNWCRDFAKTLLKCGVWTISPIG